MTAESATDSSLSGGSHCCGLEFVQSDRPGRLEAFTGIDDLFLNSSLEKVLLPGAGHLVHLARPAEVNPRKVAFFTKV